MLRIKLEILILTRGRRMPKKSRFPVTHVYVTWLRSPVPGYVWLRYLVTQPGSRLRMVTLLGYAARFPVTHGYANSQKRCVTDRYHGYARNRVTGDADP